jgi:phenylalanyl-tRNA synthetase beta chain
MKVPYSIIKTFVPSLTQSPQELSDIITLKSYEVDSVYNPGENLANIVVGHVKKVDQHPNADKLNITEVLVDNNETLKIVCGAKNIELGQKVAVAKIGSTLPNGLNIQPVNLRGEDSFGMICSAKELGLAEESDGILVLPSSAEVGAPIVDALGLNEAIIDIDNKGLGTRASDSSSFYGVSREVALITNNKLKPIDLSQIPFKQKLKKHIHLETDLCTYYSVLELSGLSKYKFDSNILSKGAYRVDLYVQTDIFKLDSNIHKTLTLLNQKTYHPAVDLGNYILFEIGQPVHIFDAEKVKGDRISVREAKKGEVFVALDESEILLEEGDIVICDSEGIIALAGIMGGLSTAVGDGTTRVLIESANFDANRIRRTARRLKLLTESARRFERQIPVELADVAIQRIINIVEKSGLQVLGYLSKGNNSTNHNTVQLDYDYVRSYTGIDISDNEITDLLNSLDITVHKSFGAKKYSLKSPYWRLDLNTPEEYIEEIARLYGYDNIPTKLELGDIKLKSNDIFNFKRKLSEELSKMGYVEVLTYPYSKDGTLQLLNPVDESRPYLRQNLTESMSRAIESNSKYSDNLRLFEISNVFTSEQHLHMSLGYWNKDTDVNVNANQAYFDLLRLVANLGYDYQKFTSTIIENKVVISYSDQGIGWVDLSGVIELDLSVLSSILSPLSEKYTPIPKYPSVKRDITVSVSEKVSSQEVYTKIQSLVSKRCYYIGFRDRFQNDNLVKYTFHLEFRDDNKSLSDDDVNIEIDHILKQFESKKS